MTKFKDFRGVEFPRALIELGFEDASWNNDAAARAQKAIDGAYVVVWCLASSRKERVDVGDGVTERTPRFRGYVVAGEGGEPKDWDLDEPRRHRFSCETEADLKKRVGTVLAKLKADAKAPPRGRRQK